MNHPARASVSLQGDGRMIYWDEIATTAQKVEASAIAMAE
jgi:hypothetical protein